MHPENVSSSLINLGKTEVRFLPPGFLCPVPSGGGYGLQSHTGRIDTATGLLTSLSIKDRTPGYEPGSVRSNRAGEAFITGAWRNRHRVRL